jgi:hypothetical protein
MQTLHKAERTQDMQVTLIYFSGLLQATNIPQDAIHVLSTLGFISHWHLSTTSVYVGLLEYGWA